MARSTTATTARRRSAKKPAATTAKPEQKTPEQALTEKLELDRFVERLRRKFH